METNPSTPKYSSSSLCPTIITHPPTETIQNTIISNKLDENVLDIFGETPLFEPLELVKCLHCSKTVKNTHFRQHLSTCLSLMTPEERSKSLRALGLNPMHEKQWMNSDDPIENSKEKTIQSKESTLLEETLDENGIRVDLEHEQIENFELASMDELREKSFYHHANGSIKKRKLRSWAHMILYGPSMPDLPTRSSPKSKTCLTTFHDKHTLKRDNTSLDMSSTLQTTKTNPPRNRFCKKSKKQALASIRNKKLSSSPLLSKSSTNRNSKYSDTFKDLSKDKDNIPLYSGVSKMNPTVANRIGMIRAQLTEATQRAQAKTKARAAAAAAAAARGITMDYSHASDLSIDLSRFSKAKEKSKVKARTKPKPRAQTTAEQLKSTYSLAKTNTKAKKIHQIGLSQRRTAYNRTSSMDIKNRNTSPLLSGSRSSPTKSNLYRKLSKTNTLASSSVSGISKTLDSSNATRILSNTEAGKPRASMMSLLELKKMQNNRAAAQKRLKEGSSSSGSTGSQLLRMKNAVKASNMSVMKGKFQSKFKAKSLPSAKPNTSSALQRFLTMNNNNNDNSSIKSTKDEKHG